MLLIPDVRQAEDYDCGAAAVDAVCKFYAVRDRGPVKLANRVQGMNPDTVEAVLRASGFRLLSGSMTVGDLKHLTASGRPVLCPVALNDGHWVVIAGVARGFVHYHDSCTPPGDDPVKRLRAAAFEDIWHDRTRHGHEYDAWGISAAR